MGMYPYLDKSVEHHVWVERIPALPGRLDDRVDILVPEDPVGRVDLRNVAKEPLGVDFVEDRVALQVQQAVEKKLQLWYYYYYYFRKGLSN